MDTDNTIECDEDAAKPRYPLAAAMHPREYEETSASFWAFAATDEDGSFSDVDHDYADPMPSFGAAEDSSQGDNFLFQRHVDHGP
ncbi:hypothetical protein BG003_009850, partial [Podila horticola]